MSNYKDCDREFYQNEKNIRSSSRTNMSKRGKKQKGVKKRRWNNRICVRRFKEQKYQNGAQKPQEGALSVMETTFTNPEGFEVIDNVVVYCLN
jgi:hypothetical protein